MAGIFNLFGSTSDLNRGRVVKPLSRSKTTLGITGPSTKSLNQPKPKGLSIRTNSDVNVSTTSNLNQDAFNKDQDYLKPKLTQLDNNERPISPRKELLKAQSIQFDKINTSSPKKILDKQHIKVQKAFEVQVRCEEVAFKKPFTPKKPMELYPEPERLAYYYDMQFEFDDIYSKAIENEFKELLRKKSEVQPYEDEGFDSDPEPLEYELPTSCVTPKSDDDEWKDSLTLDLPELSDDDLF
ncbi:uncharacterized protein LOC116424516 [Nomia melanderi]|uniref:uncharacterized protein LOC116424516 n=1 Tax=Nomia melanderi TaxID=2448451 RepID=UPI0013044BE0|nr:uncharacterized protein LOC116424516 [Nomia melanderi]